MSCSRIKGESATISSPITAVGTFLYRNAGWSSGRVCAHTPQSQPVEERWSEEPSELSLTWVILSWALLSGFTSSVE
jgi:hypothetical protein